jgi:hypothetical protein
MTRNTPPTTRDEVLFAFHQACERPTTEQILDWTRKYPQFADDIRAHAAVARDWAAMEGQPVEQPDDTLLARGFSRVLDALYNAEAAVKTPTPAAMPQASFHQLMTAQRKDVRALARELDIERGVIADLMSGRMRAPAGKRFANAVGVALSISPEVFEQAHLAALAAPRIGFAKAEQAPTAVARSYADIIRDSGMSPERKRYWLEEEG